MRKASKKDTDLYTAFLHDIEQAWRHAQSLSAGDEPYAFWLYGCEGGNPELSPYLLTEQTLTEVAGKYIAKGYYDTLDEARKALRYSVADSPRFDALRADFQMVHEMTAKHVGQTDDVAGYKILSKAAIAALKKLDEQGLFGTGERREKLLLGIEAFDVDEDFLSTSIRQLNSPSAAKKFEKETEVVGHYLAAHGLCITGEGKLLYTIGSSKDPAHIIDKEREFAQEMNLYEVRDNRLQQRWNFFYQGFGDSMQAIGGEPTGESVIVARVKNEKDKTTITTLLRYRPDSNQAVAEAAIEGGVGRELLTISADGNLIAAGTFGKQIHLLNLDLKRVSTIDLPGKIMALRFLRNGQLLTASPDGLSLVDSPSGAVAGSMKINAGYIAVSPDETWIMTAPFIMMSFASKEPEREIPATVIRLPDLSVLETITLPGLRLGKCAVSSDGRLAAFEAKHIDQMKHSLVICDLGTHAEVARKRARNLSTFRFMPDNKTIAIAGVFSGQTAPVELWNPIEQKLDESPAT